MHVRMPMLSLSLVTLSSSLALAAPMDSKDASVEAWSPLSSSYALVLPERSDVLRLGTLEFDSEIMINTEQGRGLIFKLMGKRPPTEEEKASDLEQGEEARAFTSLGSYGMTRQKIRSALHWLAPEEALLEWANQAELPSGSVLSGTVRADMRRTQRSAPQARGGMFLRVEVIFEDGKAKRTVEFAGTKLSDAQVKKLVAYLEATDKELEAIEGRI